MQENEEEKAENDKSSEPFNLVDRSESREEQQIEEFPRSASPINDLWASPLKEPKNGIVERRVCPPEGKPTRQTNQLDYLLHHVIIKALKSRYALEFKYPVNAVRLKLNDYHNVVKRPMDLTTIENRLLNVYYTSANECLRDIETIFENCSLYNSPDNYVSKQAGELRSLIYKLVANMPKEEITQTTTKASRVLKRSFEQMVMVSVEPEPLPPKASSNALKCTKSIAKKSVDDDSIFKLPAYIRRSGNSKSSASPLRKRVRPLVRKTIDVFPQGRNHGDVDKEVEEISKPTSVQKLLPKNKKNSSGADENANETVGDVTQCTLFDSEQGTSKKKHQKPSEDGRTSEKMDSAETKKPLKGSW
ncbi:unnamed protein product, partial [Mesorhabditis belari]|uniref:Bromo domain-containing protein n=1 Tax=Mesorhabditis belari TaxID=2138241 RepID=A0AAF3EFF1_9BILA